eukprot:Em0005g589a
MFFVQKALFIILILGVIVPLALMFYYDLLDSLSDDDHVRLLGAHHHIQTVKNEDIDHNRREDIVMPLPGVDASVGRVLNTEVPVDRVDLNVPKLNAHVFNEQADGNVPVGSLHQLKNEVELSVHVSDSSTKRTPTVQVISSQQASTGDVFDIDRWNNVCINLSYGDILTLEEFNTHIFGHFNPGSVSVVFKEWRGISARSKFRVSLNGLELVLSQVKNVQKRTGINTTFLAADIGKFGSATLQVSSLLWESFSAFFDQLYKGSKSVLEWEKSFEQVSGTEDRDFVAMLQATVVSHAKCVIFVGHGNFQKHTKHMYEECPRQ